MKKCIKIVQDIVDNIKDNDITKAYIKHLRLITKIEEESNLVFDKRDYFQAGVRFAIEYIIKKLYNYG